MTKEARNNVQIWSAMAMLAFGAGLSIAGFCVEPVGEISDSVLLVLAQCFIYAGSALGIDYYVNMKINKQVDELKSKRVDELTSKQVDELTS